MSMHSPERRESIYSEDIPKSVQIILGNRGKLAERLGKEYALYTPPAHEHYLHLYPWDAAAAAYILAHHGYIREAETETFSIFKGQHADGMVPNIQRVHGFRPCDLELLTFSSRDSADYSQPPIWPMAIQATYQATKEFDDEQAKLYLSSIYPALKKSLKYFVDNRQLSNSNPLIFNTHPHETGRDSDPTLNGYAPKLPRNGLETHQMVEYINSASGYFGTLALGGLNRINGWDANKIRNYYRPVDPMYNSIYAYNMRITADLARDIEEYKDADYFHDKADTVEEKIISDLWEPEARQDFGAFLVNNIKGRSEHISIGSLGPLLLENLPEHQLEQILDLMDSLFNTRFTLATVATDCPSYDPEARGVHRVWDGSVKMIANFFGIISLRKQAQRVRSKIKQREDLAWRSLHWSENRILPDSKHMLSHGYFEKFSPNTSLPQRTKTVKDFVWDGLIETL